MDFINHTNKFMRKHFNQDRIFLEVRQNHITIIISDHYQPYITKYVKIDEADRLELEKEMTIL